METLPKAPAASSMVGMHAPNFTTRSSKDGLSMAAFEGSKTVLFCHPATIHPFARQNSSNVPIANLVRSSNKTDIAEIGRKQKADGFARFC